jgi:acetyltransferase
MSTRNLDALFRPDTIALIGASNQVGSVGAVLARNLLGSGFKGAVWPVNPHETTIQGAPNFKSLTELASSPDLAVIATPPACVPNLIQTLGRMGCRAAIVITAGDNNFRANVLDAARPTLMRLVGPNCLGFLSPARGINASFAHMQPQSGSVALLSQSGAIATSMLDWATGHGIGFSHIVSLGDMADIDFGDLLDFLAQDAATRSILLYVEAITSARKFLSAARIAARAKPVIVVKAGRGKSGARAAASHTGALAGSDAVYSAAFQRAGLLRVDTLRELFDAAETLACGARPVGDRLTILTNGGGLGVIAADETERRGVRLATLSQPTMDALNTSMPPNWSHANPVDILGDASGARYSAALAALLKQSEQDAMLVINCPTGVADTLEAARAVITNRKGARGPPLLACWMGEATAAAPRELLRNAKIPTYETPEDAVRAFHHLVEFGRNQAALIEIPEPSQTPVPAQRSAAKGVIENALAQNRVLLSEIEAKSVLAAYGVPIVETHFAADAVGAAEIGAKIGGPVALKILSRDITHKSDVGGVRLNLEGAREIEAAAVAMLERVRRAAPTAQIDGFTVQAMITRPHAHELIVGIKEDQAFGPVIMFGQGGVAVEVLKDSQIGLPPLNSVLAHAMISRTRVAKLLGGYRDRPPADIRAVAGTLVAVSEMIIDLPEIEELDINPLLCDAAGVIALDARIVVRPDPQSPNRLAIRPYPSSLARDLTLADGAVVKLRPVRPEDAERLAEMGRRTSANDLRLRFHGVIHQIDAATAARLTQIDYDREMAIIAIAPDASAVGVVRIVFDPDFQSGEYAVIVRSDFQNLGLGRGLIDDIAAHARSRGAQCMWGDVLAENRRMIDLAHECGAELFRVASDPSLVRTTFSFGKRI